MKDQIIILNETMNINVSILVPCFNVESYIRECLDSLVNQTLSNIEIICINDGSTDNTLSILKEYEQNDARVKIINKSNSGYGHSMNQGLLEARGEYVGIVESDDFADSKMFEALFAAAKFNDVDVVKSNYFAYYTANKSNILVEVIPTEDLNQVVTPKTRQGIFWSQPCIWAAIYKRDFLINNKIEFLETPGASYQDLAFNFKVWAKAQKAYFLPDAYLHYRQDNEQSSVKSAGKVYCVCDEYHEMERYIQEHGIYDELKYLLQRLKYASYRWNFERLVYPLNYQFLKTFVTEFRNADHEGLLQEEYFGANLYKRLKKMIKSPFLFFLSYWWKNR